MQVEDDDFAPEDEEVPDEDMEGTESEEGDDSPPDDCWDNDDQVEDDCVVEEGEEILDEEVDESEIEEEDFQPEDHWEDGDPMVDVDDSGSAFDQDGMVGDAQIDTSETTPPEADWAMSMVCGMTADLFPCLIPAQPDALASATAMPPADAVQANGTGFHFTPERKYSFSGTLARQIGVDEAIIIAFFTALMLKSSRRIGDKRFVRITTGELERLYPWKTRKAWGDSLRSLCEKQVLESSIKWRRSNIDMTRCYTVLAPFAEQASDSLLYFRAGDALEHGVCSALLLLNLRHWLEVKCQEHGEIRPHAMRPLHLSKLHPFSVSTIKRALNALCEKNIVEGTWNAQKLVTEYTIPGFTPACDSNVRTPTGEEATRELERMKSASFKEPHQVNEFTLTTPDPDYSSSSATLIKFEKLIELNRQSFRNVPDKDVKNLEARASKIVVSILERVKPSDLARMRSASDQERLIFVEAAGADNALTQELGVIALRSSIDGQHSHELFHRAGYSIGLALRRRINDWERSALSESFESNIQALLASRGEQLRSGQLTPSQNAKVLRQALMDRARIGKLYRTYPTDVGTICAYPLRVTGLDGEALTRFFARNQEWTAQTLFDVIEKCADLNEFTGEGDDALFCARRGAKSVRSLLCNLEAIINELGMAKSLPRLIVVTKEELYPERISSRRDKPH